MDIGYSGTWEWSDEAAIAAWGIISVGSLLLYGVPMIFVGMWTHGRGRSPHYIWLAGLFGWFGVAVILILSRRFPDRFRHIVPGAWKIPALALCAVAVIAVAFLVPIYLASIFTSGIILIFLIVFSGIWLMLFYTLPVLLVGLAAMSRGRSPHYMWFPAPIAFVNWLVAGVVLVLIFSLPNKARLESRA